MLCLIYPQRELISPKKNIKRFRFVSTFSLLFQFNFKLQRKIFSQQKGSSLKKNIKKSPKQTFACHVRISYNFLRYNWRSNFDLYCVKCIAWCEFHLHFFSTPTNGFFCSKGSKSKRELLKLESLTLLAASIRKNFVKVLKSFHFIFPLLWFESRVNSWNDKVKTHGEWWGKGLIAQKETSKLKFVTRWKLFQL